MHVTAIPDSNARRDLQKIAGCDDPKRVMDIVFIHGLGGDSWTSWMANKNDMTTFWPNWLAEDVPKLGLWTLGYAASASKWQEESMPLADRGNQLLDLLANEGLGVRPLAFITHSMGGIVVKQMLRNADSFGVKRFEPLLKQTKGIAFIATPHSGAHIANFAALAAAVYRTNEQVKELAAHDPRLRELHSWFLNKYLENHEVICRTYCERREVRPEIPLLGIRLPKGILVVDETSAEPNIKGEQAIPLDADHIGICKPPDRRAQIYRGMLRFVEDCLATSTIKIERVPQSVETEGFPFFAPDLRKMPFVGRDDQIEELVDDLIRNTDKALVFLPGVGRRSWPRQLLIIRACGKISTVFFGPMSVGKRICCRY